MKQQKSKLHRDDGFTLIEVIIVLAIVSIIFMIIFLAFTSFQKNRRDYERRRYAERLLVELHEYYNRNGKFPANAAERDRFKDIYMPEGNDPQSGQEYEEIVNFLDPSTAHAVFPNPGELYVSVMHWCNTRTDGENETDPIAGNHENKEKVVVWIGLEKGSFYCVDNFFGESGLTP